ncbi:MAG: hypothetical protein AB1486_16310 [Planctomycetota bacterium]
MGDEKGDHNLDLFPPPHVSGQAHNERGVVSLDAPALALFKTLRTPSDGWPLALAGVARLRAAAYCTSLQVQSGEPAFHIFRMPQ